MGKTVRLHSANQCMQKIIKNSIWMTDCKQYKQGNTININSEVYKFLVCLNKVTVNKSIVT